MCVHRKQMRYRSSKAQMASPDGRANVVEEETAWGPMRAHTSPVAAGLNAGATDSAVEPIAPGLITLLGQRHGPPLGSRARASIPRFMSRECAGTARDARPSGGLPDLETPEPERAFSRPSEG